MDNKEFKAISKQLSARSVKLLKRYMLLRLSRITKRGCKFLLHPDEKDLQWGIRHFGHCESITETRAEKLITNMEIWQRK